VGDDCHVCYGMVTPPPADANESLVSATDDLFVCLFYKSTYLHPKGLELEVFLGVVLDTTEEGPRNLFDIIVIQ